MTYPVWDTADTVDPSMLPVSPAIQDLLREGAAARIEVGQWRAAFGENALRNAQQILAERARNEAILRDTVRALGLDPNNVHSYKEIPARVAELRDLLAHRNEALNQAIAAARKATRQGAGAMA
ncbi:hypothetical protein ACGFIW_01965 [Micromonospora sp. NPDC048935]|uniref:hypothetical protein n=1 Tax=Micromonospora sp. NPDC048935 TaxID=3364262 RepID=UPI00371EAB95